MLTYDLEQRNGKSKTACLYERIKEDIITGTIVAGERLPSKREMAEHLSVSVITVENAYALLEEEGYVTAKERSGFYVNRIPLTGTVRLDPWVAEYLPEEEIDRAAPKIPGMAKIMRRLLSEQPEILQMQPPHLGCAVLRNAIAEHLHRYRGMNVRPSHVIIGSGAEYLYGLIVQLFGRDKAYGIEDPSYEKIEQIYRSLGAGIVRLKMGEDGIKSEALQGTVAQILHVTPYHSYPTGVTATAEKRYEYLAFAKKRKAYLIEDDVDSEFSFYRKPIETLFSMDRSGRVIYMNTFSKSISPSIRIAYMVLPEALLKRYERRLGFYSCTVPVFDQYVLAAFIREGGFERQLNRIRRSRLTPS